MQALRTCWIFILLLSIAHDHGTHTDRAVWQEYLKQLLDQTNH